MKFSLFMMPLHHPMAPLARSSTERRPQQPFAAFPDVFRPSRPQARTEIDISCGPALWLRVIEKGV